jgi:hypothetical protein
MFWTLTDGFGLGFTVTIPLAVAVHPEEFVAETVYVPPIDSLMLEVVAPVFHTYVAPPVAVKVAVEPEQTEALLTEGVGVAFTVKLAR